MRLLSVWKRSSWSGSNTLRRCADMAKSEKGKPFILVRLDPEVFAKLHEVAGETERGRGGGMAAYVRKLIHDNLGFAEPETYAAERSPRYEKRKAAGKRGITSSDTRDQPPSDV